MEEETNIEELNIFNIVRIIQEVYNKNGIIFSNSENYFYRIQKDEDILKYVNPEKIYNRLIGDTTIDKLNSLDNRLELTNDGYCIHFYCKEGNDMYWDDQLIFGNKFYALRLYLKIKDVVTDFIKGL